MALPKTGVTLTVMGEKEYKQALSNVASAQKELKSELKLLSETFKENANSQEFLTKKQENLNDAVDLQKDKINLLNTVYENSTKKQQLAEEAIKKLNGEYEDSVRKLKEMRDSGAASEEEIKKQEDAVLKLSNKLGQAQTSFVNSTNAVNNNKTALNNANAELVNMQNELKKADKFMGETKDSTDNTATSIDKFGREIKNAEDKVSVFGDVLAANLASEAIIDGLREASQKLKEFVDSGIEMAADLAESQNVVDVTFQNSADEINKWSTTLANSFGMTELQGKTYAGVMGSILKSTGFTTSEITNMSTTLVQLAGDIGSFKNVSAEDMFGKIRAGITGETEPLKQLGYNLSVANLEAFALAKGIDKTYSTMSQKEQTMLRYNYLLEVTSDAQGDFARTSDGYANQQKIFQLNMQNLATSIGKGAVPELQRGFNVLNKALNESGISFEDLAADVTGDLVDGFEWVIDNLPLVASGIAGVTSAVLINKTVVPVLESVNALWVAYQAKAEGATIAQWALNGAQAANPMGALAVLIGGVVTALAVYAATTDGATNSNNKLVESHKKTQEEMQKTAQANKEEYDNALLNVSATESLKEELLKLNSVEKLSNEQKSRYASIVEQLNNAMPDLNFVIDENTGKLSLNNKELEAQIENAQSYYKVVAAREKLTKLGEEQFAVETEIAKLTEDIAKAQEDYNKKLEESNALIPKNAEGMARVGGTTSDAAQKTWEAEVALRKLKEQLDVQTQSQGDLQKEFDKTTNYINDNSMSLEENATAAQNQTVWQGQTITTTEEVQANIEELTTSYNEAKTAAEDSISSQMGLFDEFETKSDLTLEQIGKNLEGQVQAMNDYQDNIIKAQELVAQGFDETLLKSIMDMGIEGSGYLNEFVNGFETNKEETLAIMEDWKAKQTAEGNIATAMAEVATDYTNSMNTMLGVTKTTSEETKKLNSDQINDLVAKYGTLEAMEMTRSDTAKKASDKQVEIWVGQYGTLEAMDRKRIDTMKKNNDESSELLSKNFDENKKAREDEINSYIESYGTLDAIDSGRLNTVDTNKNTLIQYTKDTNTGVVNAMNSGITPIANSSQTLANIPKNVVSSSLGIQNGTSTVAQGYGYSFANGMAGGINQNAYLVNNAVNNVLNQALSGIGSRISNKINYELGKRL